MPLPGVNKPQPKLSPQLQSAIQHAATTSTHPLPTSAHPPTINHPPPISSHPSNVVPHVQISPTQTAGYDSSKVGISSHASAQYFKEQSAAKGFDQKVQASKNRQNRRIFFEGHRPVDWGAVGDAQNIKHPSEVFHSKPKITLPKHGNPDHILAAAELEHSNGALTKNTAMHVLGHYIRTTHETLAEEWKSFGHLIGKAGAAVYPMSLVEVHDTEQYPIGGTIDKPKLNHNHWPAVVLSYTYAYRAHRAANAVFGNYRAVLNERIAQQLHAMGFPDTYVNVHGVTASWTTAHDYEILIAVIDMFLTKFPSRNDAIIRQGTIVTRHKDCAAMSSLQKFGHLLNVTKGAQLEYIWFQAAGVEVADNFKPDQETNKPDSYTPYLTSFIQNISSPYSAKSNPNMHTLVHVFGSGQGDQRSINARLLPDAKMPEIITNAIWLIWLRRGQTTLAPQFYDPEEETLVQDLKNIMIVGGDSSYTMTGNMSPLEYYVKVLGPRSYGADIPKVVRHRALVMWSAITNPRPDTIGKYMKDYADKELAALNH